MSDSDAGRMDMLRWVQATVAAAKRKGVVLNFTRVAARLRRRMKHAEIEDAHILAAMVRAAAELCVPIEIDEPTPPSPIPQ
jgi:hypothetical protein